MKILNPCVLEKINKGEKIKLELGSGGKSSKDNFFSLDLLPLPGVDIVADLSLPLNLIPDNSVENIFSRHTLEHVPNILNLVSEIHRICDQNAQIEIIVPHFSNVLGYSDPTHVRLFGFFSFYYFTDAEDQPMKKRKVPSFYIDKKFYVRRIKIQFYRITLMDKIIGPVLELIVNLSFNTQITYERRFSGFWHAWQIRYSIQPKK